LSQFQDDEGGGGGGPSGRAIGIFVLVISLIVSAVGILIGGVTLGAFFSAFGSINISNLPLAAQTVIQNDISAAWVALSILAAGIFIVAFFAAVHVIFGGSDEAGEGYAE
jgi:hypothetical protein